ncbi:MAG: LPS export ABC transporter periplasmic protein LptC [candidate division WS1 bacterium]|jgi:LPS export ABC transporter protein LptC|nr:LPS export ABC transporter periplasmic protein LptC [candidate division WS1 bacterium]
MRERLGLIIIAVTLAAVVIVIAVGLSRRPAEPEPPSAPPTAATPEASQLPLQGNLTLQGSKLTQKDEQGNVEWSLQADTELSFDAQRQVAEGQRVHWQFQRGPDTEWTVDAPQVVYKYDTGRLEFTQGVELYSTARRQRISVKRLVYVSDAKELRGEGPVRLTDDEIRVTANHLLVDLEARRVKLSGGVRCHVGS